VTDAVDDDLVDAAADQMIGQCLDLTAPRSFFLYAGAGSGKTRSLVSAIRDLCERQGRDLSLTGRKIAIITYTNAACDEIVQRLEFDPRIDVSTIHAFLFSYDKLIGTKPNPKPISRMKPRAMTPASRARAGYFM
jgi:DNA helicase-2/ATP-dependent DNA helicase PcrA